MKELTSLLKDASAVCKTQHTQPAIFCGREMQLSKKKLLNFMGEGSGCNKQRVFWLETCCLQQPDIPGVLTGGIREASFELRWISDLRCNTLYLLPH